MSLQLLNAGCGTHYADGWVNVDVWESDTTKPDVKVNPGKTYPFPDNHFDAIYLGHVLEHIDWREVSGFLDDMKRMLKPGAPMLIVGPDIIKTIRRWANGQEPWNMVMSTLEHQDFNWQPGRQTEFWDGATHHWNCHHERVWNMLKDMGFLDLEDYYERIPNNVMGTSWRDEINGITWPVVGKWHWQFAIKCTT